jgi:calpain-7
VSAFSPTHFGEFSLLVCSSRCVEVDPIPQEGAGMFSKTMRGDWCVLSSLALHVLVVPIFGGMTDPILF